MLCYKNYYSLTGSRVFTLLAQDTNPIGRRN